MSFFPLVFAVTAVLASTAGLSPLPAGSQPTGLETSFSDAADVLTAAEEAALAVDITQKHQTTGLNFGFGSADSVAEEDVNSLAVAWAETNEAGNSYVYVLADPDNNVSIHEGSVYASALSETGRTAAATAIVREVQAGNSLEGLRQGLEMYGQLMPPLDPSSATVETVDPPPVEATGGASTPTPLLLDAGDIVGADALAELEAKFESAHQQNLTFGFEAVETTGGESSSYLEEAYTEWTAGGTLGGANVYLLYVAEEDSVYLKPSSLYLTVVPAEGVEAVEAVLAQQLAGNPRSAVLNATSNLEAMLAPGLAGTEIPYPEVAPAGRAPSGSGAEETGGWFAKVFEQVDEMLGGFTPLLFAIVIFVFLLRMVGRLAGRLYGFAEEDVTSKAGDVYEDLKAEAFAKEERARRRLRQHREEGMTGLRAQTQTIGESFTGSLTRDGTPSPDWLSSSTDGKGHTDAPEADAAAQSDEAVDPFKPSELSLFEFKPLDLTTFDAGATQFSPLFAETDDDDLFSSSEGIGNLDFFDGEASK